MPLAASPTRILEQKMDGTLDNAPQGEHGDRSIRGYTTHVGPPAVYPLSERRIASLEKWCRTARLQAADAEDVVQEVVCAAFCQARNLLPYGPADSVGAWLFVVTRNKIRDVRRRERRARTNWDWSAVRGTSCEDRLSGEASFDTAEWVASTARLLALLCMAFRVKTVRAFWQVVILGRRPAWVAEDLGISVNAVRLAKGRVVKWLRLRFADRGDLVAFVTQRTGYAMTEPKAARRFVRNSFPQDI